ncbi:MAG: hypothetical protein IPN11_17045 [Opitutaceae bacterium]|nr:hypothetical protein [Opitutaceae bacterium]
MTATGVTGQVTAPQAYLRLGFYDAAYTGTGAIAGLQSGTVTVSTPTGFVMGTASAYGFGASPYPLSVWLADLNGGSVNRVGFTDAEHTRNDGFQTSAGTFLHKSGWAAGTSARYNGGATALGQNVWLAHAATGTTVAVGLTGAGYVRADGLQSNTPFLAQDRYLLGVATATRARPPWATPSGPPLSVRPAPPSGSACSMPSTPETPAPRRRSRFSAPPTSITPRAPPPGAGARPSSARAPGWLSTLTGVTTRVGFFDAADTFSGGQHQHHGGAGG